MSIREFIPNIRWTFIFSLDGLVLFSFRLLRCGRFTSFLSTFSLLRATMSFVPPTWLSRHLVSMLGRSFSPSFFLHFLALIFANFFPCLEFHLRHLSFFIYGAYFRHLFRVTLFTFYFISQYKGNSFHR